MKRTLAVPALGAMAAILGAAQGPSDPAAFLLVYGAGAALLVLLGLPAALALAAKWPRILEVETAAVARRRTSCILIGAALFVLAFVVLSSAARLHAGFALGLAVPVVAWALVGFAGCARHTGERLLATDAGLRPLVIGWLVRAGALATPLLWPAFALFFTITALGAPAVALIEAASRRRGPPTP